MTRASDGRVEIAETIYLPSVQADGNPSDKWIPFFAASDLADDD
ncbi:hypothetical protein [Rathayibacter sp. VKM Ac-2803]|nr:hypothetical protein [Rathayibacter sp. VKM Ac-2803]